MKKQINSTINAHLPRGACYLLLLLAVCAIPLPWRNKDRSSREKLLIRQLSDSPLPSASHIRQQSKTFTGVTGSGQTRTPAQSRRWIR